MSSNLPDTSYNQWLADLKEKIRNSQLKAALKVNAELLSLYWELGAALTAKQKESNWGDKIITQLAKDLSSEFPEIKGFSVTNLKYIRRWFQFYHPIGQQPVDQLQTNDNQQPLIGQQTVDQIVQQSVGQFPNLLSLIPWGHHIQVISKCNAIEEALYYVQQTAANNWSRNVLVHQIESGLYQRKGKAHNNFELVLPKQQSDLARELLKNPYNLDFLSLGIESSERELENALIANIKKFLLELGNGFSYVGQQYNIKVGDNDYYIDLLFYHTRLHCYVVVELKVTEFVPEFAGKLEFYLTAIDEQLKTEIDAPTIGLLLCRSIDKVVVEYSLRNKQKPMGVAEYRHALPKEYQTELPSEEILKEKLESIAIPTRPMQEKIARLKDRIANLGKEEVQKERGDDDIWYIYKELVPALQKEIESNLEIILVEFRKAELNRKINGASSPYFTDMDIEAALLNQNVNSLGLSLRLDGFKKAGTNAFGMYKDVYIDLHQYKYGIGKEQFKPWVEKLYHQKLTKEEIVDFAERWCEELIEEIEEQIERIAGGAL